MPNPYDKAYELAKIIEEDKSYIEVRDLTRKVMEKPEQVKLIEEFRKNQFKLQQKQMQGEELAEDELEEVNKLYEALSENKEIKQLLDAEERLSILFGDINRIITGPLEKIYNNIENK